MSMSDNWCTVRVFKGSSQWSRRISILCIDEFWRFLSKNYFQFVFRIYLHFFRCWDILFSTCSMFPTREALHNVSSIWPSILIFTQSLWFRNEWTAGYDERVLLWTWCFSKFWNQSFLCPCKLLSCQCPVSTGGHFWPLTCQNIN